MAAGGRFAWCYCHRHVLYVSEWLTIGFTIAAVLLFISAVVLYANAKQDQAFGYVAVDLEYIGNDTYRILSDSSNCTSNFVPRLTQGYILKHCVDNCTCYEFLPNVSAFIAILVWISIGLFGLCFVTCGVLQTLGSSERNHCLCVPPYTDDKPVHESCHGEC